MRRLPKPDLQPRLSPSPAATAPLSHCSRTAWHFTSPDGFNVGGGGSSVVANGSANLKVVDIVPLAAGVDTLFSDGSVYFSPDGMNLGGGGSAVVAYSGTAKIASLTAVSGGVDALFADGGSVYFSADGRNLGGGGASVNIYNDKTPILQIVPVGAGVVTLLKGGTAYFSPATVYRRRWRDGAGGTRRVGNHHQDGAGRRRRHY